MLGAPNDECGYGWYHWTKVHLEASLRCWGSIVSQCEGGISKEHYLSRCLISDQDRIGVRGFKFCVQKIQFVSIASAVAKCLCRKHNSELTNLDAEAVRWKNSLQYLLKQQLRPESDLPLCGWLFERWIAKTICSTRSIDNMHQSPEYIRLALSGKRFKAGGFYIAAEPGDQIYDKPELVSIRTLESMDDPDKIAAGIYFWGFRFVLSNIDLQEDRQLAHSIRRLLELKPIPQANGLLLRPSTLSCETPGLYVGGIRVSPRQVQINWD